MPLESQPPDRRGTVGHPYSALNLRLVLASFGFVVCTVLAVLLFRIDRQAPAIVAAVFAAVALVDVVVVQMRRRARRHADNGGHSLFE
jgi:hypothetical protein